MAGRSACPRLIGEARALEIILTGRTVEAEEAERIGLVNRITEGDLIEAGTSFRPRDDGLQPPRPGVRPQRDPTAASPSR